MLIQLLSTSSNMFVQSQHRQDAKADVSEASSPSSHQPPSFDRLVISSPSADSLAREARHSIHYQDDSQDDPTMHAKTIDAHDSIESEPAQPCASQQALLDYLAEFEHPDVSSPNADASPSPDLYETIHPSIETASNDLEIESLLTDSELATLSAASLHFDDEMQRSSVAPLSPHSHSLFRGNSPRSSNHSSSGAAIARLACHLHHPTSSSAASRSSHLQRRYESLIASRRMHLLQAQHDAQHAREGRYAADRSAALHSHSHAQRDYLTNRPHDARLGDRSAKLAQLYADINSTLNSMETQQQQHVHASLKGKSNRTKSKSSRHDHHHPTRLGHAHPVSSPRRSEHKHQPDSSSRPQRHHPSLHPSVPSHLSRSIVIQQQQRRKDKDQQDVTQLMQAVNAHRDRTRPHS